MELIKVPGAKFIATMLGFLSVAYIVAGVACSFNLLPAGRATDQVSTFTYFIMGGVFGAISIFMCFYKRKDIKRKNAH